MTCSQGKMTTSCLCCKEAEVFQKIIDLKSIGLIIYRYTLSEKDFQMDSNQKFDNVSRIAEDLFIVHNTKNMNVSSSQCVSELMNNKINCPRCRKIVEHAQKLLQYLPTIEKDEIRGFCDLCILKQKTCDDCNNVLKKFIKNNQNYFSEDTKNRTKQWLSRMNQILEAEEALRTKRRRAQSVLNIKDFKEANKPDSLHKVELYQTFSEHSNQIDFEVTTISETPSTARLYYSHLKEKRLKTFEHIPPARQHSVEESFFKSKNQYPDRDPTDTDRDYHRLQRHKTYKTLNEKHVSKKHEDDIPTDADKVKTEFAKLRKLFSEESLLTVTATSSKHELLKRNFTFYFPKKTKAKAKLTKKHKTSSELIISTHEQLEERKKHRHEMQRLAKLEAEKKKAREREEKKTILEAKKALKHVAMEEKRRLMTLKSVDYIDQDGTEEKNDYDRKEVVVRGSGERGKQEGIQEKEGKVKREERIGEREKDEKLGKVQREKGEKVEKPGKGVSKEEKTEREQKEGNREKVGKEKKESFEKTERESAGKREKGKIMEKSEKSKEEEKIKGIQKTGKLEDANVQPDKKSPKTQNEGGTLTKEDILQKDKSDSQKAKSEIESKREQTKPAEEKISKEIDEKHDKNKFKPDSTDQKTQDLIQKTKTDRAKTQSEKQDLDKKDVKKTKRGKKDELQENMQVENKKGKKQKENEKTVMQKLKQKAEYDSETSSLQKQKLQSINDTIKLEQVKLKSDLSLDLFLKLVKIKPFKYKKLKTDGLIPTLSAMLHKHHFHHKNVKCPFCASSDLELVAEDLIREDHEHKEIIIGKKIYKYRPSLVEIPKEPGVVPLFYKTSFVVKEPRMIQSQEEIDIKPPKGTPTKKKSQFKIGDLTASTKGILQYALSDRSFIDKGWTMLPTEKVVKKMNVYRMRPAQPEFDWFKHNRSKGLMNYDTGEKLAEFTDDGHGRWFYRNGRIALDHYDAEEPNAQQRIVVYSSGDPDSRGRSQPFTILATFDYSGNGIVFDHSGKIRMKYNQSEGIILDRSLGPITHWKWHTLNDPPVLQQIMIDTQAPQKDPDLMNLCSDQDKLQRKADEEMMAIEFDNFVKEKSKKLNQTFKPFKIKMKAIKINDYFSLKMIDQATVYLLYRDGTTHIKLNIGMKLDHKEIIDTETSELGEVSNNMERMPARSESLNWLQKTLRDARRNDRVRSVRERRLQHPGPVPKNSVDLLKAATSKPLQIPIRTAPSSSSVAANCYCSRKPTKDNVYYDTSVF